MYSGTFLLVGLPMYIEIQILWQVHEGSHWIAFGIMRHLLQVRCQLLINLKSMKDGAGGLTKSLMKYCVQEKHWHRFLLGLLGGYFPEVLKEAIASKVLKEVPEYSPCKIGLLIFAKTLLKHLGDRLQDESI